MIQGNQRASLSRKEAEHLKIEIKRNSSESLVPIGGPSGEDENSELSVSTVNKEWWKQAIFLIKT
jgi:hypothetical protein